MLGVSISIEGAGADASILYWPHDSGGMAFTWSNIANSLHVRDVSFTTSRQGGGTALSLSNSNNWRGYQIDSQKEIARVSFRGDDGTDSTQFWTQAIYVQAVNYINFSGILVYGGIVGGVNQGQGIVLTDHSGVITANYNIIGSSFLNLDTGLLTIDNPQGVAVTNSSFVDNSYGIATRAGSTELQGMLVTASTFNNRKANIDLQTQVNDVQFTGNTFIIQDDLPSPSFNVSLSNVARFTFVGNDFIAFAAVTDPALKIDKTNGWPGTVLGNSFSGPYATAIELTSNSSNVTLQTNAFATSIASRISNAGSNNIIDIVQPWTPVLEFGGATTGIAYATQSGSVSRNGDNVLATFRIALSSMGSAKGAATVRGFPTGTGVISSGSCGFYTGMSNALGLMGYFNGTSFNFTTPGPSGVSSVSEINFTHSSDLVCTVAYVVSP